MSVSWVSSYDARHLPTEEKNQRCNSHFTASLLKFLQRAARTLKTVLDKLRRITLNRIITIFKLKTFRQI